MGRKMRLRLVKEKPLGWSIGNPGTEWWLTKVSIRKMLDAAREQKFTTMRERCDLKLMAKQLGYAETEYWGLTLKDDATCKHYASVYRGKNCCFMTRSKKIYIFW